MFFQLVASFLFGSSVTEVWRTGGLLSVVVLPADIHEEPELLQTILFKGLENVEVGAGSMS